MRGALPIISIFVVMLCFETAKAQKADSARKKAVTSIDTANRGLLFPDWTGKKVVTALDIPVSEKTLGGSIKVIGDTELNTSGTGNFMDELEGKVSGLTVINSAADPGAGTYMNLRGITSLTGNNQPLMVVDGIPIDNSINNYDPTNAGIGASGAGGNLTGSVQPTNRALDINPSDIESIMVLKGPAATALYGMQAAGGALLITTKKGGKNHAGLGIEFNSSESWSTYDKLPALQNSWAQGSNGAYYGPTSNSSAKMFSWGPAIDTLYWDGNTTSNLANNYAGSYNPNGNIISKSQASPGNVPGTSYNPYSFFQTGVTSDNNVSFAGGSDAAGFRVSLGNLTQTGIIPLSKYTKNTFNLNGSMALSKKIKVSAGVNYTNSVNHKVQQGYNSSGATEGLLLTPPTFDNSNGISSNPTNTAIFELPNTTTTQRDFAGGSLGAFDNPYWTINQNPFVSTLNRIFGYVEADYSLVNIPKTNVTFTYRLGSDMYWQNDNNAYDVSSNDLGGAGGIFITNYTNEQLNSDVIVTINHRFSKDFTSQLILGENYFDLNNNISFSSGTNFVLPHFLDLSNASSLQASQTNAERCTSAWYGEGILGWKNQVFLTLTGRDETSSTLPAQNDINFYPSASLAWVFTEAFKPPLKKLFPFGKIRLSYAAVGRDAPIEALQAYYHSASVADEYTSGISFPFNGANQPNGVSGYEWSNASSLLGNSNLVPEQTNSFETGADFAFFDSRISISYTFYSERTENGIFTSPLSYTSGWGEVIANTGVITNTGDEITLNTTPVKMKNSFRWDLGFNWSHNTNEVVSLAPDVNELFIAGFSNAAIMAVPGQPYGEIYGTDYVKTSGGQMVIDDNPHDPGYGMPIPGTTALPLGNIQPRWIGGMNNAFSYKNFSLGIMFTTRQGGDIWDGTLQAMEYYGTAAQTNNRYQGVTFSGVAGHVDASGNIVHTIGNGLTAPGPGGANNIPVTYSQYYWQNIGSVPASNFVLDGSYIRISQICLGYNIPAKWIKKAHLINAKLTFFANNPVLWTKYPGVDPETSLTGPANGQGLDYFNSPGIKSYGVRLNLIL